MAFHNASFNVTVCQLACGSVTLCYPMPPEVKLYCVVMGVTLSVP